jgi:hypothetical protein
MAVCALLLVPMAGIAAEVEAGFRPLFNGKNLDGWDGDPRLWTVRDGVIFGSTEGEGIKLERNTFLISKEKYKNFTLRLQIRLQNHNSGVQFRSEALPGWVVRGLQADAAENNWWGSIYEEGGKRGVMVNGWKGKAETVVKPGWNDYEIHCEGDKIRLTLNGMVTSELEDSVWKEGVIAFQLHRGPPMRAEFRNVRIKVLP